MTARFHQLAGGIVLGCDPVKLWSDRLGRFMAEAMPKAPLQYFTEAEAAKREQGALVSTLLAQLAQEERAGQGDPRFEDIRMLWRSRVIN